MLRFISKKLDHVQCLINQNIKEQCSSSCTDAGRMFVLLVEYDDLLREYYDLIDIENDLVLSTTP